jgi:hypothetical protein
MARLNVTIVETYVKQIAVEAPDAETAEVIVRGRWDQGQLDLAGERGTFDGVEVYCHEPAGVCHE